MTDKAQLRESCLEARRAMVPEEIACKSLAIAERLRALKPFRKAKTILTYVSSKDNEVSTQGLIDVLLEKGKTVLVPVMQPNRQLGWSRLESLDELVPARFGILEPSPEHLRLETPPENALVLVPGVAFTKSGYRIGYGGGYYDRFLAGHEGPKIGLAFDLQIIPDIEPEEHDVPCDLVVTESAVYPTDA